LLHSLDEYMCQAGPLNVDRAVAEIDSLMSFVRQSRVRSHLEFILDLPDTSLPVVLEEARDFVADLIALGHSESFLFGWGRSVILGDDPSKVLGSLCERLMRLGDLGTQHRFSVLFKISGRASLPRSECLSFGRGWAQQFSSLQAPTFKPGESAVLANVRAADNKAAVQRAKMEFEVYQESLSYRRGIDRIAIDDREFLVRCEDDGTERVLGPVELRPYEPPPMQMGNMLDNCRVKSPRVFSALEKAIYWVANSRKGVGEAAFLSLWLALVSLFETDDVSEIAPLLACYRISTYPRVLASWVADYLGKCYKFRRALFTPTAIRALRLAQTPEHRLQPIVANILEPTVWAEPCAVLPLLGYRVAQLAAVCSEESRLALVRATEEDLQVVLPWVQSVRHTVSHFASSHSKSLDLAIQHLREDVTTVFDQVASSASHETIGSISDVHAALKREFSPMMSKILAEPCLSPLHVRMNRRHVTAVPADHFSNY